VHNVSQWPNLRHIGGAKGLLEAASFSFKKATESIGRGSDECKMAVSSRLWGLKHQNHGRQR